MPQKRERTNKGVSDSGEHKNPRSITHHHRTCIKSRVGSYAGREGPSTHQNTASPTRVTRFDDAWELVYTHRPSRFALIRTNWPPRLVVDEPCQCRANNSVPLPLRRV
eukprot:scaffold38424_cov168-Amphora_coffeaeformis.AAC.8